MDIKRIMIIISVISAGVICLMFFLERAETVTPTEKRSTDKITQYLEEYLSEHATATFDDNGNAK